ncbi:MAG TPA: CoA ester lyase [Candidatus Thermoplasmatota archaeon]|nr:CoA ester lyase [Candidatus Thermoplasmatota archaeon]
MTWKPRRSVLFTPGTRADRWAKALEGPADVAVADLEDAVAPADKVAARRAVAEALRQSKPGKAERAVRINVWPGPWAVADVDVLAPLNPELVVVPKAEVADEIRSLDHALQERGCAAGLLLVLETARGVLRAPDLALSSKRIRAIAFGAEDYAASVGARRTPEGLEVLYARSRVVAAAAAAGVGAIDQVWPNLEDIPGLEQDARFGATLGYTGKMLIHPNQVEVVHRALKPTLEQLQWAKQVMEAVQKSGVAEGGVVVVEGRMIDRPLIAQAERILALGRV